MKDKDFDDIAKRLYDLEADPPKNGWKKIGSAINTYGPTGRVVWLRKNWWKPLILLVPLGAYFLYSVQQSDNPKASYTESSSIKRSSETENNPTPDGPLSAEDQSDDGGTAQSVDDQQIAPDEGLTSQNDKATISKDPDDRRIQSLADQQSAAINSDAEGRKHTDSRTPTTLHNTSDSRSADVIADVTGISETENDLRVDSKEKTTGSAAYVNPDDSVPASSNNKSAEDKVNANVLLPLDEDIRDQSANEHTLLRSTREASTASVSPPIDTTHAQQTATTSLQTNAIDIDSVASDEAKNDESEKVLGKWRITFSLAPQYISKSVRPVATDEVLVTGIDQSRDKARISYSFAAGAGLSVTDNFYLDAQLSYTEAQQNIFFSYATGNIDTLIAVQQPDQSVRVTPVYETSQREISSKYRYAGIRLGATKYFWSTSRRRFNISGTAGAHYLVSADVKEKRNGNWVALKNDDLNKLNYTIMISAGYNINLSRGWELMINPAITYYLRKVKSSEVPYDIDQQSAGLNFMLSKTLGRR